ncbi:MAG: carboxypeptidase regulatory-like domain-containing protein [Planctomycetes bacterium]|nr:carboxypeptidase regulatory-like domain-containing protein [Planctomycetota bacterium]
MVLDEKGIPVENAKIRVVRANVDGDEGIETMTDKKGEAKLDLLEEHVEYLVDVEAEGFADSAKVAVARPSEGERKVVVTLEQVTSDQ